LLGIAFAGNSLGYLRGAAAGSQPNGQMGRMESNGELFFDQLSQTPTGPQLAGKAIVDGVVRQPTQDDLLLGPRQFRRSATDSPRYESSLTLVAKGRDPATHTGGIDAQEIRHLLG